VFAEVVNDEPGGQTLQVHIMTPTTGGLHEAERDDTSRAPARSGARAHRTIATAQSVRYAMIRSAEDQWTPEWIKGRGV